MPSTVRLSASLTLTRSYGFSFWIIPVFSAIQGEVALKAGIVSTSDVTWWMPLYLFCNASTQILFASNSDLFGRRWFLIVGNLMVFAGLIIIGAGVNTKMIMAGCAVQGLVRNYSNDLAYWS